MTKILYQRILDRSKNLFYPTHDVKDVTDIERLQYYYCIYGKSRVGVKFFPIEININVEETKHYRAGTKVIKDGIEHTALGGYLIPTIVTDNSDFLYFNNRKHSITSVLSRNDPILFLLNEYYSHIDDVYTGKDVSAYSVLKSMKLDNIAYMVDIYDDTYRINSIESYAHINGLVETGIESGLQQV